MQKVIKDMNVSNILKIFTMFCLTMTFYINQIFLEELVSETKKHQNNELGIKKIIML